MFGEHAAFIIPAYLISFLALAITAIFVRHTYKKRLKELEHLERQGAKRRAKDS